MPRETAQEKLVRMTQIEEEIWAEGLLAAGIDEAGRGPLAGPVSAACVVLEKEQCILGVDDSKKLSEKKREELYERIVQEAKYARCVMLGAEEIDRINILQATKRAMEQAAQGAQGCVFLVDAVTGLMLPGEARSLIKGDAKSHMIAAASILAKVTRDRYMRELDERYPQYGFARHKGYGTAEHIAAIREFGPCPEHRRSFLGNILGDKT